MQRTVLAAPARRLLPWIVVLVATLAVRPAWADPATEGAAKALQKKAVEEDFLNMDYASAIKKLQSAVARCDGDKCSPPVKGAILRDLGAMQVLSGNEGEGRASFGQALAADASLDLDPSYKNAQLEGVWNDVKKKAAAGAAGGGGGGGGGAAAGGGGGGAPPAGDFTHTPAAEAPLRTPLPIYAEYSGSEQIVRVIVKYKGVGMTDWKPLELKKMGEGWGGLVPCKDVTQGAMTYYIQGFNAANDPVATSGSRNKPFSVAVKTQVSGEPPALPGQQAPKQCGELAGAECPPDFPGCNAKKASGEDCDKNADCQSNACVGGKCADKKGGGEDCSADDECSSGSCSDGKCGEARKAEGDDCDSDDQCDSGSCKAGKCGGGHKGVRFLVGVSVSLDLYMLSGAQDVCKLNSSGTAPYTSGNPYSCFDSGGAAFPGNNGAVNSAIQTGHSDQVQGGFAHGPLPLSVSFDYVLNPNMLLGGRVGFEALTGPSGVTAFAPVRLEARFTYLIGAGGITRTVSPMVFGGVGVGEFDAYVPVQVFNATNTSAPSVTMNAWTAAGPLFVNAGGGVLVRLGKKLYFTGAAKLMGAFGGQAGLLPGVAPELGLQYGF